MSEEQQKLAEAFLREAVFRSRSKQAAGTALSGVSLDDDFAPGRCGLGQVAIELGLDGKGEELFLALWPDGPLPRVWISTTAIKKMKQLRW